MDKREALVVRKCYDCIYFTQAEGEDGMCHLTPRARTVLPEYWCSHGVWYEWNEKDNQWEPHLHGEVNMPDPPDPHLSFEALRQLIRKGNTLDTEQ